MRKTLDRIISATGLLLAIVLLIGGGLLTWANQFIGNEVNTQLSEQKIVMPTDKSGLAQLPAADQAELKQYAGKPLTTGPEAKAYAEHFIKVHLNEAAGGQTYSQVSGAAIAANCQPNSADPNCQKLAGQKQTLFMGETLRGLLLYGYAFATIGTIAGYAAIVAFIAALLLLILAFMGFRHARRMDTVTS